MLPKKISILYLMQETMKKTNVTLRKKVVSNGRLSLYLDFYPPIVNPETNLYTRGEFLKLYDDESTNNSNFTCWSPF